MVDTTTDDLLDGYVQGMIARKTLANFDNVKKTALTGRNREKT